MKLQQTKKLKNVNYHNITQIVNVVILSKATIFCVVSRLITDSKIRCFGRQKPAIGSNAAARVHEVD